jgi:hypothetical protein
MHRRDRRLRVAEPSLIHPPRIKPGLVSQHSVRGALRPSRDELARNLTSRAPSVRHPCRRGFGSRASLRWALLQAPVPLLIAGSQGPGTLQYLSPELAHEPFGLGSGEAPPLSVLVRCEQRVPLGCALAKPVTKPESRDAQRSGDLVRSDDGVHLTQESEPSS